MLEGIRITLLGNTPLYPGHPPSNPELFLHCCSHFLFFGSVHFLAGRGGGGSIFFCYVNSVCWKGQVIELNFNSK